MRPHKPRPHVVVRVVRKCCVQAKICSFVTRNGDSRRIAEKLLRGYKQKQTKPAVRVKFAALASITILRKVVKAIFVFVAVFVCIVILLVYKFLISYIVAIQACLNIQCGLEIFLFSFLIFFFNIMLFA
jgi:hypothetical protein